MKTKILIVDDLRENIIALSRLIEGPDVELYSAESPDDALSLFLDHEFGLALFDVQMPTMTGFELARLVRSIEKGRHLPVIFVTAQSSESQTIFEGYESGAVDVLFKPLDPHIVRSKVRVFVRLDQQSRLLHSQIDTMARLKEEAEAANIAKSRFLANMSHEIRTPLSAVLGFADILSQSDLTLEERHEYLSSISRNGKLLLRIIDDILDFSKIEAQKIELEKTDFDMMELVSDMEKTLASKAEAKGIRLEFESSPELSRRFISDPLRIKQILLNLVGNAIKFTNDGFVRLKAERLSVARDAREVVVKFSVEDTGIGLSQEEAKKLFEPFAQADNSTRRKYGGTGLGLTISKQLAKSLGGDVALERSEKGRGSVFVATVRVERGRDQRGAQSALSPPSMSVSEVATIRTGGIKNESKSEVFGAVTNSVPRPSEPAPLKSSAETAAALEALLKGKKVLVVDDVIDNRVLMERFLRPSGAQIQLASGAHEALEMAEKQDWDLVLMDIQMPNMDGYEATARLRNSGFRKPIVAVTAHAMREELDRCVRAGCDTTMTKPVTKKALVETLATVLT